MKITGFGTTHPGNSRPSNQDAYFIDNHVAPGISLYIVCDGSSGDAGSLAASTAAHEIQRSVTAKRAIIELAVVDPTKTTRAAVADVLRRAVMEACSLIHSKSKTSSANAGMFTTVDVLLVSGTYAMLAHVGDGRVYLRRAGKTHKLTEDHTYFQEMIKDGSWTAEEARKSPFHKDLTRAVGLTPIVQVDLLQVEVMSGDMFLLCTDGLSDYMHGKESPFDKPKQTTTLPQDLVQFALAQGGKDNVTAVVVEVKTEQHASKAPIQAMQKIEFLRKTPLFRHLAYQEVVKILSIVQIRTLSTGQTLVKEGEPADEMFVILEGKVDIRKGGITLLQRTSGNAIGEMGLLDNRPRSASAVATQPTTVMMLSKKDLFELLRKEPEIALKFQWGAIQELIGKLRTTTDDIAESSKPEATAADNDLPFHSLRDT